LPKMQSFQVGQGVKWLKKLRRKMTVSTLGRGRGVPVSGHT